MNLMEPRNLRGGSKCLDAREMTLAARLMQVFVAGVLTMDCRASFRVPLQVGLDEHHEEDEHFAWLTVTQEPRSATHV
jgi:hypothetical protein